jgi:hypothetical protein
VQEGYERPAAERAAVVTALVDATGKVGEVHAQRPSGDLSFDDHAINAVASALARNSRRLTGSARLVTFRLSATRMVRTLRIDPVVTPAPTRRVTGLSIPMRFRFDETTGKVSPIVPFTDEVKTKVTLISVEPAPIQKVEQ